MALTRAQGNRTALEEPIYETTLTRKSRQCESAVHLGDLPNELVLQILDHLELCDSFCALRSLCRVDRALQALTTPYLYRHVRFSEHDAPSFALFLRTILYTPSLRQHTRAMDWLGHSDMLSLQDATSFAAIVEELALPGHKRWLTGLRRGDHDAYVAVALSLLPNLQSFTYDRDLPHDKEVIPDLANPPAHLDLLLSIARQVHNGTPLPLSKLRNLTMEFNPDDTSHISALFLLPSVRFLELQSCSTKDTEFADAAANTRHTLTAWECPPMHSAVTELSVDADLPGEIVDVMIKSCASLRRFWLSAFININEQPKWFYLASASLRNHHRSLTCLSFEGSWWLARLVSFSGHLRMACPLPKLERYEGPLCIFLSTKDSAEGNQLRALARAFGTRRIRHILLDVPATWNSHLLFNVDDPLSLETFPLLRSLAVRFVEMDSNAPNMEHVLSLAQYFENSKVNFDYEFNYWGCMHDFNTCLQNLRKSGAYGDELVRHAYDGVAANREWPTANNTDMRGRT